MLWASVGVGNGLVYIFVGFVLVLPDLYYWHQGVIQQGGKGDIPPPPYHFREHL